MDAPAGRILIMGAQAIAPSRISNLFLTRDSTAICNTIPMESTDGYKTLFLKLVQSARIFVTTEEIAA